MYLKHNIFTIIIILALFAIGGLLITVNPSTVLKVLMMALAIFILLGALNFLIRSKNYSGQDKKNLEFQSIVMIVVSISLLVMPKGVNDWLFRIIIGIIFIILPLFTLYNSSYKKEQFRIDIPKYIIGIVLVFSYKEFLKVILVILGLLTILIGVWLIYQLVKNRKNNTTPNLLIYLGIKYFLKKGKWSRWE